MCRFASSFDRLLQGPTPDRTHRWAVAASGRRRLQVLHEKNKDAALSFWQSMARDARLGPKVQMEAQREVELHQGVRPAQEHRVTGQLSTTQRPTVIVREVIVRTRAEAQAILAMQREPLAQIQAQQAGAPKSNQ
jgi:hypothetical protein